MYRSSILFVAILMGMTACHRQAPLNSEFLVGKSVIEIVDIPSAHFTDTCITTFINDSFYKRSMGIYIQREGKYEVINDTLEIHYGCPFDKCEKSNCAVQRYILDTQNKLRLVYMTGQKGISEDLDNTPFDKVLDFIHD